MRKGFYYYLIIFFLLVADQITKVVVAKTISPSQSLTVIPGFLNLTHTHNRGAIFGFFSKNGGPLVYIFLTLASLIALSFVIYYFFKTPFKEKMMKISLSMILAGAVGNLLDRVFKGYVIDFIDVYVKKWHWPTFNVADSSITVGAFLLIFILLRRRPKCSPSSSK